MNGFIFGFELDGTGGGTPLDESTFEKSFGDHATCTWLHLDYSQESVRKWLIEKSGLSEEGTMVLLANDTRPRVVPLEDSLLICLRVVNVLPDAEEDDMVSLRMWIKSNRIITIRQRRVKAVEDVKEMLHAKKGPLNTGDFLYMLARSITTRIADSVGSIEEHVDEIEDQMISEPQSSPRRELSEIRRKIIRLRRHLVPQREVINRLYGQKESWIDPQDQIHLREIAEINTRIIDDTEMLRDRASVTQEEINLRISEHTNRIIYIMSIVATIFLPLSLFTGLLGINVGGIPGQNNPLAFIVVCGIIITIAVAEYILFRRKHIL